MHVCVLDRKAWTDAQVHELIGPTFEHCADSFQDIVQFEEVLGRTVVQDPIMIGASEGRCRWLARLQRSEKESRCHLVTVPDVFWQGIPDAGWVDRLHPLREGVILRQATIKDCYPRSWMVA